MRLWTDVRSSIRRAVTEEEMSFMRVPYEHLFLLSLSSDDFTIP